VGSYANAALTGHGQIAFAGGSYVTVFNVYAEMITPALETAQYGFAPVERLFQFAWLGIGFSSGGGYHESVTWHRFLDIHARAFGPGPPDPALGDQFWWDVMPGGVLRVELDW
jgi:hypothetical protein